MRLRDIQLPGMPGPALLEFYQRMLYSSWVLATGQTGFTPFAEVEPVTLRNYQGAKNFFTSQRGAVLSLQAQAFGPTYGAIDTITSATYGDILDALNRVINQSNITIALDSVPIHQSMLSDLVQIPSLLIDGATGTAVGFNAPAVPAQPSSQFNRQATTIGVPFSPPIIVDYARTLTWTVTLAQGVTVPAVLNTFVLQFRALIEEYPNANVQQVRT